MNAINQLENFKTKIDKELGKFLNKKLKESEKISPETKKLVEVIKDIVLRGGKRLRPAFVYFAYKACGGKKEKAIIYTSQAIEFLHTFALIHDDIIDKSEKRRGKPAVHQILGEPGTILAGDLCFVFADEIFTNSAFKDKIIREVQKIYDLLREEVVFGQYLDVLVAKEKTVAEEKIMKILEYKSGKYTIERPLHLGAALAEAPLKTFKVFSQYGIPLGIAFQIQDDILGMFGRSEESGKPVDSDLKEGKKTLLVVKALEALKGKERKKFLGLLGNQSSTLEDLAWVREIIKKTDSLDYSRNLAKKLIQKAKEAIKEYPLHAEGKEYLLGIADYMLERRY